MDIFPPFTPRVQAPAPPLPVDELDFLTGGGELHLPDPEELARKLAELPPDPTLPIRPRPPKEVLLERKRWALRFWRERNERMIEDEKLYKMLNPVEEMVGGDEIGAAETFIGNDPYVLVEKMSNMVASSEPVIHHIPADPGLKDISQRIKDFLVWWREEAEDRWVAGLNNYLARDELYYLALRGWLTGRVLLDPGDPDWPYRYDLIDPIHVYPRTGAKGLRWVYHIYRDSKANIIADMGFSQGVLDRIEYHLGHLQDEDDVEVASYYDSYWHVMYLNDVEVWSAPHNYGFVPWVVAIAYGPPIRRTDTPLLGGVKGLSDNGAVSRQMPHYTKWWGVSVFEGIKDVYAKMNKLASAVMTEAMKAPNPPVVIYTNQQGEAEGKTIDTSIGATNYLLYNQEKFDIVQYGFKADQLMPLLQMLNDARNRGGLPSVMFGEGANYLSGFAVNLLQAGARDVILPLVKSHEGYLKRLYRMVLQMTAEIFPKPISMVSTNPNTGERDQFTQIDPEEIKLAGYRVRVIYRNVGPQDRQMQATLAAMLTDKKIISLDTARGPEFLNLQNPQLENQKVLADFAYLDPEVVKAAIPWSLLRTDPWLYIIYQQVQQQKALQAIQQAQFLQAMAPAGNTGGGEGEGKRLPNQLMPDEMQPGFLGPPPPPGAAPQQGPV